jgi:hypothetical protein
MKIFAIMTRAEIFIPVVVVIVAVIALSSALIWRRRRQLPCPESAEVSAYSHFEGFPLENLTKPPKSK